MTAASARRSCGYSDDLFGQRIASGYAVVKLIDLLGRSRRLLRQIQRDPALPFPKWRDKPGSEPGKDVVLRLHFSIPYL